MMNNTRHTDGNMNSSPSRARISGPWRTASAVANMARPTASGSGVRGCAVAIRKSANSRAMAASTWKKYQKSNNPHSFPGTVPNTLGAYSAKVSSGNREARRPHTQITKAEKGRATSGAIHASWRAMAAVADGKDGRAVEPTPGISIMANCHGVILVSRGCTERSLPPLWSVHGTLRQELDFPPDGRAGGPRPAGHDPPGQPHDVVPSSVPADRK